MLFKVRYWYGRRDKYILQTWQCCLENKTWDQSHFFFFFLVNHLYSYMSFQFRSTKNFLAFGEYRSLLRVKCGKWNELVELGSGGLMSVTSWIWTVLIYGSSVHARIEYRPVSTDSKKVRSNHTHEPVLTGTDARLGKGGQLTWLHKISPQRCV